MIIGRLPRPLVVILRSAPLIVIVRSAPSPAVILRSAPSPVTLTSAPTPVILRSAPYPCHSEERTTKNLRCLLTRRTVAVTGRPSEEDFRFLTAVRNDRKGGRSE